MKLIDVYPDFGGSWKLVEVYRDENNKKRRKKINNFVDYFYCSENKLNYLLSLTNNQILKYEKCNIPAFQFEGDVYKVYLQNVLYSRLKIKKLLNWDLSETFELDIDPAMRYVLDRYEKFDRVSYHTLFFDIETTTDYGFPDWENPKEKITCISFYDNYKDEYKTYVLNPQTNKIKNFKKEVKFFNDERDMLENFLLYIDKNDYDILTGWNISFDLSYLFGRCDVLKINKTIISPYKQISIKKELNKQQREVLKIDIKGRFVIDLLERYKAIIFKEIPSYSLEYVSEIELGLENSKKRILNFTKEWKENLEEFLRYSKKDVKLLVELNNKLHLIDYLEELRLISYLPNIYYASISKHLIDAAIFRMYKGKLLLPSKLNMKRQKLGGGYVKIPKPGIYENVAVYDFSGMYPSLIQTFNLSKDTIVDYDNADFIIEEDDINEEELGRKRYKVGWTLNHRGIIPTILTNFLKVRRKIKEEMKKVDSNSIEWRDMNLRQYALKAPINANYGVNAYPGFRLYEPKVAATITYLGRKLNRYCSKRIEEDFGVKVIYNDTDSFFVKLDEKDEKLIKQIQISINEKYVKEFIKEVSCNKVKDNYIFIEYEKFFSKLLLVKKRRYLGILENGEWIFKGVDLKRSNTPEIIREILLYYLNEVFKGEREDKVLNECYRKLYNERKNLSKFKIPLKISKQYSTNLPQQRAANWANSKLKSNFKEGSKFYGLYVKNQQTDIIGFTSIGELDGLNIEIDIDKYTEILKSKLNNLNANQKNINFNAEQTLLF